MSIPVDGEQIVGAVCRAIHEVFPTLPIYKDPIDQDIEEPCFFVWESGTETNPVIWPKFREAHHIEVRFYPGERETQHTQGRNKGPNVIEAITRITIKHGKEESLPIFATDITTQMLDSAVAVSATYKTEGFIDQEKVVQSMGDLSTEITQKKE